MMQRSVSRVGTARAASRDRHIIRRMRGDLLIQAFMVGDIYSKGGFFSSMGKGGGGCNKKESGLQVRGGLGGLKTLRQGHYDGTIRYMGNSPSLVSPPEIRRNI
jgi:hypothetical protein